VASLFFPFFFIYWKNSLTFESVLFIKFFIGISHINSYPLLAQLPVESIAIQFISWEIIKIGFVFFLDRNPSVADSLAVIGFQPCLWVHRIKSPSALRSVVLPKRMRFLYLQKLRWHHWRMRKSTSSQCFITALSLPGFHVVLNPMSASAETPNFLGSSWIIECITTETESDVFP